MIDAKFRLAVRNCFHHYKKLLGIAPQWKIAITIKDTLNSYAEVNYDFDAKKFDVFVNPKLNQDLDTLKDSILHECIHIFLTPMTSKLDLLLEEVRNKRPINYKKTKKKILFWEEFYVDKFTKIIVQLEKEQD
jgi:protoheme ferro-lyase